MDVWGAFDRSTGYIRLIDFKKLDEKGKHRFGPASAAEVIPKVQEAILPGCVIISDGLRAYRTQLEPLGYSHRSVCHKDGEFVSKSDPDLHTNSIDGSWGCFKNRIRAFGGIRKERLPLALYEFMWRHNTGISCPDVPVFYRVLSLLGSYSHVQAADDDIAEALAQKLL